MITFKEIKKGKEVLTVAHFDYQKSLHNCAFFKTNNPDICKDLVQETFLKTWKYMVKGGKIEIMEAFLFNVLNGLIIDNYRKHKTISLDVLLEQGFQPGIDPTNKTADIFDGRLAFLLIEQLPEKYRKILIMKYKQQLSPSQMSTRTGQTINTVNVQASRGLEKLRDLYHEQ